MDTLKDTKMQPATDAVIEELRMIDVNNVRAQLDSDDIINHIELHANLKPILTALLDRLEAAEKERDALRAKIEAMERQGPVAKVRVHKTGGNAGIAWSVAPINDFDSLPLMRDGDRLYALPGAKGEEK